MKRTFDDAKRIAFNFLIKTQNKDKGWWPSQFRGGNASIWTTAHAIWALFENGTSPTQENIKKALDYLVTSQNKKTGGWPELRFNYSIDSVVITADVVKVFSYVYNMPEYLDTFNSGLSRLLQMQNENYGGWGLTEKSLPIVRSTAIALASLGIVYKNNEKVQKRIIGNIERGANWIVQAQNKKDNGWGLLKNDNKSKNSTTAWAIWSLSQVIRTEITVEGITNALTQGCNWLVKHQARNGSWIGDDEPAREILKNMQFPAIIGLDTPFMVMALLNSLKLTNKKTLPVEIIPNIHEGIGRLIETQEENGSWRLEWDKLYIDRDRGGRIWATAYYFMALNIYEKVCKENFGKIINELILLYKHPVKIKLGEKFFDKTSCHNTMICNEIYSIELYIRNYTDEKSQFLIKFEEHPEFIISPKEGFRKTLESHDTDNLIFHITPKEGTEIRTLVVRAHRCLKTREENFEIKEFDNIRINQSLRNKFEKYLLPILFTLIGTLGGIIIGLLFPQ